VATGIPSNDALRAPAPEALFSRTFPPISRHTLALYCGASGDINPIHVDQDYARAAGFDDVFAHGMLVMAYLGTMLEEAGPPESIRSMSARFVAITQLHAAITCEAFVERCGEETITLKLVAKDETGDIKILGQASVDRRSWGECVGEA
jgi:acyl dehydratase